MGGAEIVEFWPLPGRNFKGVFMKRSIIVVLAGLLSGCAISQTYLEKVQSWEGHEVTSLIETWGAPATTLDLPNGARAYTWERGGAGGSVGTAYANPAGVTSGFSFRRDYFCKTTFIARDGVIEKWHVEGNACR